MKKIIRNGISCVIILAVVSLMTITCFAFGSSIPNGDYVYYKYWNVGGNGDKYKEVRQRNRNYSNMVPGDETTMILTETDQQYKIDSTVRFTCLTNVPATVPTVTNFYVKEKLVKKQFPFIWTAVSFEGGTTTHNIVLNASFPRSTSSSYIYNAPNYAKTIKNENLGEGDYQIDLMCPYVEDVYAHYNMMWYQAGIFTV